MATSKDTKRDKSSSEKGFVLRFICYKKRLIDYSNLSIKYIEDSIVEAGLIPDDNAGVVKRIELVQIKDKVPRTVVEIYEILEED